MIQGRRSDRIQDVHKALARRRALPGFPMASRALTSGEIEEYFSQPKILCLLCGRSFGKLARHVPFIHSITVDEYRALYGLPWRRGLCSPETSAAHAAALDARSDAEKSATVENLRKVSSAPKRAPRSTQRPMTPAQISKARAAIKRLDTCRGCGKELSVSTGYQWCSAACRSAAYVKARSIGTASVTCAACEADFKGNYEQVRRAGSGLPVACSLNCRQVLNGRRRAKGAPCMAEEVRVGG